MRGDQGVRVDPTRTGSVTTGVREPDGPVSLTSPGTTGGVRMVPLRTVSRTGRVGGHPYSVRTSDVVGFSLSIYDPFLLSPAPPPSLPSPSFQPKDSRGPSSFADIRGEDKTEVLQRPSPLDPTTLYREVPFNGLLKRSSLDVSLKPTHRSPRTRPVTPGTEQSWYEVNLGVRFTRSVTTVEGF